MNTTPTGVLAHTFSFLSFPEDFFVCAEVCKTWKRVVETTAQLLNDNLVVSRAIAPYTDPVLYARSVGFPRYLRLDTGDIFYLISRFLQESTNRKTELVIKLPLESGTTTICLANRQTSLTSSKSYKLVAQTSKTGGASSSRPSECPYLKTHQTADFSICVHSKTASLEKRRKLQYLFNQVIAALECFKTTTPREIHLDVTTTPPVNDSTKKVLCQTKATNRSDRQLFPYYLLVALSAFLIGCTFLPSMGSLISMGLA